MDQRLQRGQLKPKRPYKRKNVPEIAARGVTKKAKKRKDSSSSLQIAKQITKRPYNKRQKDPQIQAHHKGRPSTTQQTGKAQNNLIHIEVGTSQVKQNIAKNSQFNPKGLIIIDKLSEFANNYLQNPPRNEEPKKKKRLIEDIEWEQLNDRKKKYFEIIDSYPYLKSQEENSNKEKLKKLNEEIIDINQQELQNQQNEENNKKMEIENSNNSEQLKSNNNEEEEAEKNNNFSELSNKNQATEERNLLKDVVEKSIKVEQENQSLLNLLKVAGQNATDNLEKQKKEVMCIHIEEEYDKQKQEEREEYVDQEIKDNIQDVNNSQTKQIVILDDEIKEEPKQEEPSLEQQEIKEENDTQSDQFQSNQEKIEQAQEGQDQQNILLIEEKVEDQPQSQPAKEASNQQHPNEKIEKISDPTPEKEMFLNDFRNNLDNASKVVELKLTSLLLNQNQLVEDIQNESFMNKFFQTIKDLIDNYCLCLDKQDPQFNNHKMNFFKVVFGQSEKILDKINILLQLQGDQKLTMHYLFNKFTQRMLEM